MKNLLFIFGCVAVISLVACGESESKENQEASQELVNDAMATQQAAESASVSEDTSAAQTETAETEEMPEANESH